MGFLFATVLSLLAIFLILLVLVQRGRGGGLAGALGGMGGSSAFGAKAGDVFTKITIYVASIWIVICLFALQWAKHRGDLLGSAPPATTSSSSGADSAFPRTAPPAPAGGATDSKSMPAAGPNLPLNPPAANPATPPATEATTPPAAAVEVTTPPASPPPAASPADTPAGNPAAPIGEENPPGK